MRAGTSRKSERPRAREPRADAERQRKERERQLRIKIAAAIGLALVLLAGVFVISRSGGSDASGSATGDSQTGEAGRFEYAIGAPGPEEEAPDVALASSAGGTYELSAQRGKTTLLYFHEGLTCQPCWDQIVDLEDEMDELQRMGIDELVSITTDPIDQIEQKVADEGITTPVLSDPDLTVSEAYGANQYGMMGASRNGHSFIVVGPDGTIRWRADYGGAPNYTMYVPTADLLADLEQGLKSAS